MSNTFLIISDYSVVNGGAAKVAIDTAVGLAKLDNRVFFFAGDSIPCDNLRNENIVTINLKMNDILSNKIIGFFRGFYNLTAKNRLECFLNEHNSEKITILVHSWTKILSPSIFTVLKKHKFHFYITTHDYFLSCPNGSFYNYKKKIICPLECRKSFNCLVSNCDSRNYFIKLWRFFRFVFQKKLLKNANYSLLTISKLTNKYINIKRAKYLLNNPITFFDRLYDFDYSFPITFAYIGRISYEKGVDLFCESILKTGYIGLVFGDGPLKDYLCNKYKNNKNIVFFGWKSRIEITKYLSRIKAIIFPSVWYEGAPLTIPEYQSAGVPFICSDISSGADYIIPNRNGFIFKTNDVVSLADKMHQLVRLSDNDYNEMRINTRKISISSNSDLNNYIDRLIEITCVD